MQKAEHFQLTTEHIHLNGHNNIIGSILAVRFMLWLAFNEGVLKTQKYIRSVKDYMGYYRKFHVCNFVTTFPLTIKAFQTPTHTHLILLCTVFICAINLTLSVSALRTHNLLSNMNMSSKYWQQFHDGCVTCCAVRWK